jgi:hypothetical protein
MKKVFIILALLYLNNLLYSQNLIPHDTLIEDFNYFIKTLELSHPDPYSAFGNKIEFHRNVQNIRDNLPSVGMTGFDFYILLSRFLSALNDGHTGLYPPDVYPPDVYPTDTTNYSLPVKFKITVDGMFISLIDKEYEKASGAKVLAIENIQIDSLLKIVHNLRPGENIYGDYLNLTGNIIQKKMAKNIFQSQKNYLIFTVQTPDGRNDNIKINYSPAEINSNAASFPSFAGIIPDKKIFDTRFLDKDKKTAYFGWYHAITCREVMESMRNSPSNLKNALNSLYKKLELKRPEEDIKAVELLPSLFESFAGLLKEMKTNKSKYLVVDLRFNPGGYTPITIPLLYMLFGDKYFEFNPKIEYNRMISELLMKKFHTTLSEYNKNNNTSYSFGDYQFSGFFEPDTSLSIEQRRNQFFENLKKMKYSTINSISNTDGQPIYTPKIIILTSPVTFSAAYHFMWFLYSIGDAKIIGVPSSQAGNTFMENTPLELPLTHIQGSISNAVQIFFPDDKVKGKILMPDYPMNWELFKKYSFDNNAEILYVLDLIKAGKL